MTRRLFPALVFAFAAAVLAASAGAAGADAPLLPNPLRRVAAGQWVRYRLNVLFGAAEQRQTVVAVSGVGDEAIITIRTEMILDGETVDEREETATYKKLLDDQAAALAEAENSSVAPRATEFAGAAVDAVAVRYTQDGENYTLLLSDDIPLFGVIRLLREGTEEPLVELLDFGG